MQVISMKNTFFLILFGMQILLIVLCTSTIVSAKDELYIIGFGTSPGSDDENSLKQLASQNAGQYLSAEDTSTPTQLKDALIAAFSGKTAPALTPKPIQAEPVTTEPTVINTSSCDCHTYDPYYDETVECYQYGVGCSKCFRTCYEGEEPLPGEETSGSCDCRSYDLGKESMSCLDSGRDCSRCFYSCQ